MPILLTILSSPLIVIMGAFAKDLGNYYDPLEVVFIRNVVALACITAWIFFSRQPHLFKTTRIKGQLARAIIGQGNAIFIFWAYALLPLAMITSILFIAPIFILIFSVLFLKEHVGIWRWGAVIFGFIGILIIFSPAIIEQNDSVLSMLGITIALIATLGTALVQISLRFLGREQEPAITTIFYFMLIGTIMMAVPALHGGFDFIPVTIISILGIGLIGLANQILKTIASQMAEASLLAPFRYISLIWSIIIGYFAFSEIPTPETLIGAGIIIAANLIVVLRERRINQ